MVHRFRFLDARAILPFFRFLRVLSLSRAVSRLYLLENIVLLLTETVVLPSTLFDMLITLNGRTLPA